MTTRVVVCRRLSGPRRVRVAVRDAYGAAERRVGGKLDCGADVRERMSECPCVVHDIHGFARERCRACFHHERVREPRERGAADARGSRRLQKRGARVFGE